MESSTSVRSYLRGIQIWMVAALLTLLFNLHTVRQLGFAGTDIIVTNTDNSGPGSLRQAITDANNNPGPDTITFDPATDGTPIVLAGALDEDANASGDLDILATGSSLTIQGNGTVKTIIDGGGIDRVFHVCPGGGCPNTMVVTFTGVTIQNGYLPGLNVGGGIFNFGGTTILESCTVSGNKARIGGGIYNFSTATLKVRNGSTIGGAGAANQAIKGGGIYNGLGTTTVDSSTVISNTATFGGGIYNRGELNVQNGSIIGDAGVGNQADDGGGIYNDGGTTTLDDSTIRSNIATDVGGGIYNDGTGTIDGSTISANTAKNGGGIYSHDMLTVTNSIIGEHGAGNQATNYGGGIYNHGVSMLVDSCTINGNTAREGGGIYSYGAITVVGGTIISNTAMNGGGVYNYANMTLDGCTVISNTATTNGGGIYNDSMLKVQNGSIIGEHGAGNQATDYGGGIYNHGGSTTVEDNTISANTAKSGGGIYTADGTMTVTGSRILDNTATTNGGGVFNERNTAGATDVTGSCIVGNSDTSFFNNQTAQQVATLNWWGVATGPNTPGADTYGGSVDISGFLPAPILGCTPDLQVTKGNDTGGHSTVGSLFNWALTISNTGVTDAVFGNGQTLLEDNLPAGPVYGTPVIGSFSKVTNGANINCYVTSNTLNCDVGGGGVTIGATGSFNVVFSVTPSDVGTLSNPAGICRVDPDGNVTESDEGNNNCPEDTVSILAKIIYLPLVLK